jgi:N-methylhydantoinase A
LQLDSQAERWFEKLNVPPGKQQKEFLAELRYRGQNYELEVPVPPLPLSERDIVRMDSRFHEIHDKTYGHSTPGETIQLVNLRLRAKKSQKKPPLKPVDQAEGSAREALLGRRDIILPESRGLSQGDKINPCPIYDRSLLKSGHQFEGPAVIQERESTTLITPGWSLWIGTSGELIIKRQKQ